MAPNDPAELDLASLRVALTLQRMSIRQLAQATGIPYQRCQRLFRGDRVARPAELERIARAVGIR